MEEWRDVPSFEGKYRINIDAKEGRCISLNYQGHGLAKELSSRPDKNGRLSWVLYKNGKGKTQQAARWIAITFPELVENEYFEGAEIDHKDTDPLNNHPSNLRWVNKKGQMNNPLTREHISISKTGRKHPMYGKHQTEKAKQSIGKALINRKDQSKKIKQYTTEGVLVCTYDSINDAGRKTGINFKNICTCCQGKRKTAGGFKWEYEKRED